MAGSQKGLMTPPGLGFVAAGPRARDAHRKADLRTPYWDWSVRDGEPHYQKYAGTLFAEGLDNAFRRHQLLAEAARRAIAVWKKGNVLDFNVVEPAERSDTVTTVLVSDGINPNVLREYCDSKCGVVLGGGLGALNGKAFRIAHMDHVNAPMVLGTLGVVETGLAALGIAHGQGGVQAAIEWLSDNVKP
jgi:alanine-glyoxylate transaminase / serine-glyoxylate transaminase / serine-pyruvate transaminase